MELDKKMMFLQNMTHLGLSHTTKVPNVVLPSGGMSHDKMLDFVRKVTEKGLEHFAGGGTTGGGLGGAIGSFLGTQNKYEAQKANITPGTTADQLASSYQGVQGGLNQQQNLANTLTPGVEQGVGSQNTLANMYLQQAQGNGPSPAQAQLNQATGSNIAQQAALAAGQRGAGANAGLLAAQNAQQGAQTQQQAIAQAATLKAQEQLAAQSNLQNLAGNQISQGQGAIQGVNNAQQNEQNILQNANTSANNANVASTANINNVNAQIATANQSQAGNAVSGVGGLLTSVGGIGKLFAHGGDVERKPMVNVPRQMMAIGGMPNPNAPQSFVGNWINSTPQASGSLSVPEANINTKIADPFQFVKDAKANLPGGKTAPEADASSLIGGDSIATSAGLGEGAGAAGAAGILGEVAPLALAAKGGLMRSGGKVDASGKQKAVKAGDSLDNDKVPAMLSEGEIVIPRHITMGPNAPARAAQFVAQQLAKRGKK